MRKQKELEVVMREKALKMVIRGDRERTRGMRKSERITWMILLA